jgi:hypothetical protein
MLERWKYVRKRKKDIEGLRQYIDAEFKKAVDAAKTPKEKFEAEQFAFSWCSQELNELEYLKQEDVIEGLKKAPFEVPEEYWQDHGYEYKRTLKSKGLAWATHELDKIRREKIEFWFKMIVPVAALIISIVALAKKSH